MRRLAPLLLCLAWPAWADEIVAVRGCLLAEGTVIEEAKSVTFVDNPVTKRTTIRGSQVASITTFNLDPGSLDCVSARSTSGESYFVRVVDPRYEGLSSEEVFNRIMGRQ